MDWEIIETRLNGLLDAGRHSELRGALLMLPEADIAQYLSSLDRNKMVMVYRILPKSISADVFTYMDPEQQQDLLSSFADNEVASLVEGMFVDDAVDFLEELPAGVVKRVLQNVSPDTRAAINQIFNYPENSAGSIMTVEYVEFRNDAKVGECMDLLRKTGFDKETIYTSYVIDASRHLMGAVELRKMRWTTRRPWPTRCGNTTFSPSRWWIRKGALWASSPPTTSWTLSKRRTRKISK